MESWVITVILFAISVGVYSFFYLLPQRRLPPSPWGIPLVGHLHMLGNLPHRSLQQLAKKHGPIMSIRLGLVPAMVVSSPEYAELFLKTHDANFASRPQNQAAEYIAYGQKNLAFAPYGPYWRNMRKLCTLELLSSSKIELFKVMRREELAVFVKSLKKVAESGCEVDITAKIESVVENMSYRMIFGFKNDRFNVKDSIQETMELAGVVNLGDHFPWLRLRPLDLQGLGRRMKVVNKILDVFLEKIIDEHVCDAKELQGNQRDFIDVMLSLMDSNNVKEMQIGRDNIKAIALDMLTGAMDTSSTATEWVIAELLKNPRVMKLVQSELQNVVGLDRMVEETDIVKLDYLKMVIMESMRIHPIAPCLVPHESIEDITINGYFIPKKSRILVNVWAIGRDPSIWYDNAEDFYPERFLGTNVDVQGQDFRLLPFGSGRRKCPGIQLGMTVVQMVVAQLVHCFNLNLPDGLSPDDLDMSEKFGLAVRKANHLITRPTYRLVSNG